MTINRDRLPPELSANCIFGSGTGACGERQLNHSDREAERCYRELKQRGVSVRVGMEATGDSRWFERLLAELGFELWIGDPTEIKAERVRKQKTDREDARLLLKLLLENRFPRIWVPSPENRDLQQRLWHRPRLVQMRTRITPGSFRARTPVPANNGWDTLASRAIHCLRFLLGEAAQAAARCNQGWRRRYVHLTMRREKGIAKVALAAVRWY